MTQQQPEASRIVEEAGIRIIDELAVEGGRATRAHLFDKCQVMLWGHVVNVAARRAGYTGQNDAEVERHGKEQLFLEAMNLLLERDQIVVWDEESEVIALHPTHRDDYVPGTNLWRSQRQTVLNELRDQLMQFRAGKIIGDQSFDATLQKAMTLYAQQLRRGQIASDTRGEAIGELLALADVLFDPTRLATALSVEDSEIRAAAIRRIQPDQPVPIAPPKRRRTTKANTSTHQDSTATHQDDTPVHQDPEPTHQGSESTHQGQLLTSATLRSERLARNLSHRSIAELVGVSNSTISDWERGNYQINPDHGRCLLTYFATHPVENGRAS